jgi:hypothetical protein
MCHGLFEIGKKQNENFDLQRRKTFTKIVINKNDKDVARSNDRLS